MPGRPAAVAALVSVLTLAFLTGGASDPVIASHAGGMDAMGIDLEPSATPANTPSSLGTSQVCARINENNVLDADEDVLDGIFLDVTADTIPPFDDSGTPDTTDDTGGIIAFSYTFNYSAVNLTVQALNNNGLLYRDGPPATPLSDDTPDDNADNVWIGSDYDSIDTVPEDGSGWLHHLTLVSETGAVGGVYPLTLTDAVHLDASGATYTPDAILDASISVDTPPCGGGDGDFDGVPDASDNCLGVYNPGQANADSDGRGDACDNCPTDPNNDQANYDGGSMGDVCDLEDDGDGFLDTTEVHIGTNPLDNCGDYVIIPPRSYPTSASWPPDLRGDGMSVNDVDISDLGSFLFPIRVLNTSPGDANWNVRWDLVPGPMSPTGKHINIADLGAVVTSYPLMFGMQRAFNGPACIP